ncbi:MAG: septum formation initiator family protein [Chitinophagaceae bacterium]|nr:MAG: septum formation initiator family protein [Chitinophagaceae bacterium]
MKNVGAFFRTVNNKYLIAAVFFVVWMMFFDPKDWGLIINRKEKLNELEKSEKTLQKQIAESKAELHLLKTSAETIEKYAREKYMMKKDNEDLFIVKTP